MPAERGQFNYPVIRIWSVYPFGLVRAWTYLYLQQVSWIAPKAAISAAENKNMHPRFEQDVDEFRELKDYRDGESLQAVAWKHAARGQGLYVKVFEQYQDQRLVEIHYDHMPSPSHEEKLSLMMGLAEQCEQMHCAYSIFLPNAQLPSGTGEKQLMQAKLLRVLQERAFERLGGMETHYVDVRFITATNRNLEEMVKNGTFREDLYYRLNVIPIDLPPLRERGNDIALLVNFFLQKSMSNHKKRVIITDEAMEILCQYTWPGNVRELENTVERIVLMGSEDGISADEMLLLLPAFNQKLMCQRRIMSEEE